MRILRLYFVAMADTGAGSVKRKKELTGKQRKDKRDSDRARGKTQVNLSRSLNRWRVLQDLTQLCNMDIFNKLSQQNYYYQAA